MATLKHIRSKNSNYSSAIEYLLFQHDEGNMKPVLDDMGRKQLRDEYYMDGINCEAMSFDKDCEMTNKQFGKNKTRAEIKSHHFIISFDPADATECNLTGERAQALCLEFAKKNFPGFQALVVTHTDGHNGSGNIHTHIVINSVRKFTAEREEYMSQPNDHMAGYKHRNTPAFLEHLQREVMAMCEREGLHQVDLLSPAAKKITQEEYMTQRNGQKKLDELNKEIIADGLTPAKTVFQTQKQFLRDAIDECAPLAKDFDEFQSLLLEKYNISVIESRGRYRYLHPERDQRTTEKSLGSHYGKEYLEQIFGNSEQLKSTEIDKSKTISKPDYHRDPILILYYSSNLRLVIDLQTNVKAMQSQAYAQKVKISNLRQMANTIIYVQENGFDTQKDLKNRILSEREKLSEAQNRIDELTAEMKSLNEQIHFTGQYVTNKRIYAEFLKSHDKKSFRNEHADQMQAYEDARSKLKEFYPDGNFLPLKQLKELKEELKKQMDELKSDLKYHKDCCKELEVADANVSVILDTTIPEKQKSYENEL